MEDWFDVAKALEGIAAKAAKDAGLDTDAFEPDVRPADPRFGDYQVNGALPYAKRLKTNPRAIAQWLIDEFDKNDALQALASYEIAGPGFINFTFKPSFFLDWLKTFTDQTDLANAASQIGAGQTVVVDFSSPNTAKQMHVGHIRSTVIGEAICRLLEFCGMEVVRDNHIGDWGTPYGRVFYAYKRYLDPKALEEDPLEELERLYRLGSEAASADESAKEECRRELVDLQNGKEESVALWKKVNELSIKGLEEIYQQLNVSFTHYLGESFYRDKVDQVYEELTNAGIAEESEGALVVFHPEHPRYAEQPFIIRKSDGASNYATTDLATMLYRTEHFKATGIIIVTDSRQKDHFEQLDLTTRKWFDATGRKKPEFNHVVFGNVLGKDGKPIKSRSGAPIRLKELLGEAVERAYAIVKEKNPSLDDSELRTIANVVGISAVKYADLSQNRSGDYVFAWEKLLAFEGNTAPYLLYAATRIQSIFRRLDPSDLNDLETKASAFETPEELALARKITGFVGVLRQTVDTLRPHFLCQYLYELAGAFSGFYNANKVIVEDPAIKARRLILCDRAFQALKTGLSLLSIPTLERM